MYNENHLMLQLIFEVTLMFINYQLILSFKTGKIGHSTVAS